MPDEMNMEAPAPGQEATAPTTATHQPDPGALADGVGHQMAGVDGLSKETIEAQLRKHEREQLAKEFHGALLANSAVALGHRDRVMDPEFAKQLAKTSLMHADALLAALKDGEEAA